MGNTSPRGSMKGWSLLIWLERNKDSLKTLVAITVGALGGWAATLELPTWGAAAIAGVVSVLAKMLADAVDYWLSEVEVAEGSDGTP